MEVSSAGWSPLGLRISQLGAAGPPAAFTRGQQVWGGGIARLGTVGLMAGGTATFVIALARG